ncbi:MAG: DUF3488 and transglutaminase-like domain-containing protein [Phycisphaeraceae bacterium]
MALIYQFRRLAFAQVLLGIVAFCLAAQNPGMLLAAGSLGALAWYVTEGPNGRPLPRWLTNLGALGAVSWMLVELFWHGVQQPVDMVVAMGHFTMWLQILLLYSEKTNREYAQILVLSVLQMIAASVLSVSMVYGLFLAAYCVLALVTVLLFHFKSTSDRVLAMNRRAAPNPAWASRPTPVIGRGHRWHFRFMAAVVGLLCMAVAMAVFVVTPRSDDAQNPITARDAGGRSEAGFSEHVDTRTSAGSRASREPVLNISVSLHDTNVGNENRTWLLRGAALDQYNVDSHQWTRSRAAQNYDHYLTLPDNGLALADLPDNTPMLEAHITLRQIGHNALFAIHPPTTVQSDSLSDIKFNPLDQQLASQGASGALVYSLRWPSFPPGDLAGRYREKLVENSRARLVSSPARDREAFERFQNDYARGWVSQHQRIARYTRDLLAKHNLERDPDAPYTADDAEIARVLTEHLRDEFRYALDNPTVARHEDPIVEFLFNHRQGHCELFASALAAMTRSIGMQARVVTGYVASEYNRIGGYYIVRQRNAHAWTEIHAGPEQGWRTFDPTAPAELAAEHRVASSWWATLWQLYDHAEFAWIRSVVAFDHRSRESVIEGMQDSLEGAADDKATWTGQVWAFLRNLPDIWRLDRVSYTVAGLIIIAIGICLGYLARLLVIRRQRLVALQLTALPRAKRRGLARRLRFYLTMLDMLDRHGYVRPSWQSPFSFAQELAEANPMRFDPVVSLTELFYEIRFGHRELDHNRRQRITAHLKQLEHALANPRG